MLTIHVCNAQEWHKIVPLHSTCEDVKRLLGIDSCDPRTLVIENERINIDFAQKPCIDGWNIPEGTVISITVYPSKRPTLSDLGIDFSKYEKTARPPVFTVYSNPEEGIAIVVDPDERVEHITYGPTTKDKHLRYPNSLLDQPASGGDPHSILKFDEYGDLAITEEHKRLDDFALQLRSEPNTQGYIITYAGRRARAGEAQARAERAKNYLVNMRSIESARIITMDGGYRDELTVELFAGAKGGAAPIASPTVCPSEVQIIKASSAKNSNRRLTRPRSNR